MPMPDNNSTVAASTNHSGMTWPSVETLSSWANIAVVALGVAAAIAGVFALYFSSKANASKDAELLRFQNDSKIALASAEARAAEANRMAADAGEGTEKIRQENLKLSLRVEEERKARLEIERALGPRQLLPSERTALLSLLRGIPAPREVTITNLNLPEPEQFADALAAIFREAGWNVERAAGVFSNAPIGLLVITNSTTNQTGVGIQRAFAAIGLKAEGQLNPNQLKPHLIVGVKP